MEQFNLREHYSLLQALDEIGRARYREKWTGFEPWATPSDDPKVIEANKKKTAARVRKAQEVVDEVVRDVQYADSDAEKIAAQERYRNAYDTFSAEETFLRQFPETLDSWKLSYESFQRREETEKILFGVISSRDVRLIYHGNNEAPIDSWKDQDGFRIYTNLSTIRVPRYRRSGPIVQDDRNQEVTSDNPKREPIRYAAFVLKDEFETWLYKQEWSEAALLDCGPEEQCRIHLKILISNVPSDMVHVRKDCEIYCKEKVPNMSNKDFESAWNSAAPEHWRVGGRRSEETIMPILK